MSTELIQRLDMKGMEAVLLPRSHARLNEQYFAWQMPVSRDTCVIGLCSFARGWTHPAKAEFVTQTEAVVTKGHYQMRTENESRDSIFRTQFFPFSLLSPQLDSKQ
jgi:hypothetical protein